MASAQAEPPFTPKQMFPKTAALFEAIIGTTSEDTNKHIFTHLLPPFPANSLIHDNGCGSGQVTSEIMATNPPSSIRIIATDANKYQIDGCQAKVDANHWPVETFIMRAQELTFPDNYFDFSFTNFVVADLDDPKILAHHLFRTLKPGGRAIVCTFAFRPHDEAMKTAHLATRGPSAKLGLAYDPEWLKQETLRAFLVAGGFVESKISISTCDVFEKLKDLRWWMTALWGYIGQRDVGWTSEDEEKWDEAVDVLVETMAKSPGVTKTDDGGALVKFVVNVSIATK